MGHILWGGAWRQQDGPDGEAVLWVGTVWVSMVNLAVHRDAGAPSPRPHLCVQADTGSRRHWPESGRLQCLWGDRAGPDTHPRPPHSAAPQSPEDRHSGSLQVWGCRFHGCDRAGTDKHQVPLSSSVHCSLVHTCRQRGLDREPVNEPMLGLKGTQLRTQLKTQLKVCLAPHLPAQSITQLPIHHNHV